MAVLQVCICTWRAECYRPVSAPLQTGAEMKPARSRRLLSSASGSEGRSPSRPEGIQVNMTLTDSTLPAKRNLSLSVDLPAGCCPAAGLPGSAPGQETLASLWAHLASRPAWFHICQQRAAPSQQRGKWGLKLQYCFYVTLHPLLNV